MFPRDDKKYDIGLDPPLWDKFRFLKNIDLYERPLSGQVCHLQVASNLKDYDPKIC